MEIKSRPNSRLLRLQFYNVENDEKIHLKNDETLKVKRGCYTMKDIERVSSGKVKYDSLTGKSVIDSSIRRFGPYMNKILGVNNDNYIDMLLLKKIFNDVLYAGYINKDISFGDIVYFEPKNIQ